MRPSAPHLFFFTCLTADDFTRQWGSSVTRWANVYTVLERENDTKLHVFA